MRAVLVDALGDDLQSLHRKNQRVRQDDPTPYHLVPYLLVEPPDGALAEFEHSPLTAIELLVLQAIVIILFALMLDGGVRFRACLYSYVGYLAGAVLILSRRAKRLTKGDLLYLKWAWGPIIAFGVPLFVRVWKAKGLI